jgi:hypothetical protein
MLEGKAGQKERELLLFFLRMREPDKIHHIGVGDYDIYFS